MATKKTEKEMCVDGKTESMSTMPSPITWNGDKLKDWNKNSQIFQEILEECSKQIDQETIQKLNSQLIDFRNRTAHALLELDRLRDFLRSIPLSVAIIDWAKGLIADDFLSERYLPKMLKLQRQRIIPFEDSQGNPIFLDYLIQQGHQEILENIRCVDEWSLFEKEDAIQCYIQFSHSLARRTLGIMPHSFDPDRDRVRYKAIKYESFIDFVQHLSERDALIAKLLYFGATSLEEILSLRGDQIKVDNFSIQFDKSPIVFPRHLIRDLIAHQAIRGDGKKLMFTNVRGAEVERAHLNQSFARACERMSKKIKITPGSLLKMENEFIGESS